MKKIGLGIFIAVVVFGVSGMAGAGMMIPSADRAKDVAIAAPQNSPVINEEWELTPLPYYVESDSSALKALLGTNYEFDGVFSTVLNPKQLGLLNLLGVKTKPVQIYQIVVKPVCGNNIVEGGEKCGEPGLECQDGYMCADCKCKTEEEAVTCNPDNQKPWGITKVNGGLGGVGVKVAVLDSGVDQDHPDLTANIVDCVTKVTHFKPDTKSCEDGNGHGTHVSGTVLANGKILGVAPQASLMAVKVCDKKGWCYGDDMAAGIRYAADSGANIISMSVGGDTADPQILAAIDYAVDEGVLVIAAAGNDGPEYGSIDYPGAYVKVMAVGAIRSDETVPDWSSRGKNDGDFAIEEKEVEFGAPGVNIESTYNDGCYDYMSGTSMATPHVAGLAAKLWQGTASSTRSYLQGVATDIWETGDDTATGFGLPVAP